MTRPVAPPVAVERRQVVQDVDRERWLLLKALLLWAVVKVVTLATGIKL